MYIANVNLFTQFAMDSQNKMITSILEDIHCSELLNRMMVNVWKHNILFSMNLFVISGAESTSKVLPLLKIQNKQNNDDKSIVITVLISLDPVGELSTCKIAGHILTNGTEIYYGRNMTIWLSLVFSLIVKSISTMAISVCKG
jgi:hypothetical protein